MAAKFQKKFALLLENYSTATLAYFANSLAYLVCNRLVKLTFSDQSFYLAFRIHADTSHSYMGNYNKSKKLCSLQVAELHHLRTDYY